MFPSSLAFNYQRKRILHPRKEPIRTPAYLGERLYRNRSPFSLSSDTLQSLRIMKNFTNISFINISFKFGDKSV